MDYKQSVYGALLGMVTGTIAGTPQEIGPWNIENISQLFGTNDSYYLPTKRYAADDDINGPLFFIKALYYQQAENFQTEDLKNLWLNMIRYQKGMFWWGPSTERMAYENILKGIAANECGSVTHNGVNMANQIGGQIFSDCWGMLHAGNPQLAAEYAKQSAILSHDQNGVEGAKFVASLISLSYQTDNSIKKDIELATSYLDSNSDYYRVVVNCLNNYQQSGDFYQQTKMMISNLGYDESQNFGHIIPNAIICVNSLLAASGDFEQSIKYATSFGYDTDCNGSTVGSIVGMRTKIGDIADKYIKMINDTVICSSAIGSMNTNSLSQVANEFNYLRMCLVEQKQPEFQNQNKFDFELPYATNGLFSEQSANVFVIPKQEDYLTVNVTMLTPHEVVRLSKVSMFMGDQLQDLRYSPVFAPTVYPGQTISFKFDTNHLVTANVEACIYVKALTGQYHLISDYCDISQTSEIKAQISNLSNQTIVEYGLEFKAISDQYEFSFGSINLNQIEISGKPIYTIDFDNQLIDCESVVPFSHNGGIHNLKRIEKQYKLSAMMLEYSSLGGTTSLTGTIAQQLDSVEYQLKPIYGTNHTVVYNAQGLKFNSKFGFTASNQVSIVSTDANGTETIAVIDYDWQHAKCYSFKIISQGNQLIYYINEQQVYAQTGTLNYGLHGYSSTENCAGYIIKVIIND